jgi:hypothetical protein
VAPPLHIGTMLDFSVDTIVVPTCSPIYIT